MYDNNELGNLFKSHVFHGKNVDFGRVVRCRGFGKKRLTPAKCKYMYAADKINFLIFAFYFYFYEFLIFFAVVADTNSDFLFL